MLNEFERIFFIKGDEIPKEFDKDNALAFLLINDVIFTNNHWWEKEWTEEAKKTTSLNVNCNDIFAWACADSEEINVNEIEELYKLYRENAEYGQFIWCIKKRNMLPQYPIYELIQNETNWDLNKMGLDKNYDNYELILKDGDK